MTCARGCCDTPAEHYRSLNVANPNRAAMTKVTTDVHDHHSVDVTEHWHDRQDVTIKPETIRTSLRELRDGAK